VTKMVANIVSCLVYIGDLDRVQESTPAQRGVSKPLKSTFSFGGSLETVGLWDDGTHGIHKSSADEKKEDLLKVINYPNIKGL
jgi:hypothetical protein